MLGPVGQTAGLLLERELRRWRERHPESTVTLVRPDRAMARLAGLHPLALFDDERAHDVYPLAHEQGLRVGEALAAAQAEAGPAA